MDTRSRLTRRWFFEQCGVGLGAIALSDLLGAAAPIDAMAPKKPHFPPKAKRVVFLFMAGAPSHLELFDYKPQLQKFDGTLPPADLLKGYRAAFINPSSKLLGPKFQFAQHGKNGAWVSELLPHTAGIVDDIAIVKSMTTDAFNHAPGQLLMNTGTMQFGRPSFGAWVTYGLGCESRDLPAFVVFSSGSKGPSGGNSCWGSSCRSWNPWPWGSSRADSSGSSGRPSVLHSCTGGRPRRPPKCCPRPPKCCPRGRKSASMTGTSLAPLLPASLVRLSSRALKATSAELPDIDSAAISGDSVNG